jgi:hypothetical protein
MNPLIGIVVFSLIETVTVIGWAVLAFKPASFTQTQLLAGGVLFVGYVIEHIVAFNVGKGRPFLSRPRP